jgi:hypothetical protein
MFLRGSERPPQDKPVLRTIARAQKLHASAMTPTARPRGAQWASLPRRPAADGLGTESALVPVRKAEGYLRDGSHVCTASVSLPANRPRQIHGGKQHPLHGRTRRILTDGTRASHAPLDVWMPGTTLCAARGSVRSATGTRSTRRARSRHPLQPGLVECCETKTLEQSR